MYNSSNSSLPGNGIIQIAIDDLGNKWIASSKSGLSVFNEEGIIVPIKDTKNPLSQKKIKIKFNQRYPIIQISYSISKKSHIHIKVFDIKGRILKNLVNNVKRAGKHQIDFDCSGMSSGTYFVNLRVGNNSITKRIVILK